MIYVSIYRIWQGQNIMDSLGEKSELATALAFFGGMIFIAIIDKFIPSREPRRHLTVSRPGARRRPNAYLKLLGQGLYRPGSGESQLPS